jgi:hypothetical protein
MSGEKYMLLIPLPGLFASILLVLLSLNYVIGLLLLRTWLARVVIVINEEFP